MKCMEEGETAKKSKQTMSTPSNIYEVNKEEFQEIFWIAKIHKLHFHAI